MRKIYFVAAIAIYAMILTSCFKDSPQNNMFKAAGAWKIESIESIFYDTAGNQISSKTTNDYGILMLNHYDNFLYEGTFSYDFTQGDTSFTSSDSFMLYLFGGGLGCDIWSVSVDAKGFNFSSKDPETSFVTLIYIATVQKLTNKEMIIVGFRRHPNAQLSSKETWTLKRATN